MPHRNKYRVQQVLRNRAEELSYGYGCMRGTAIEVGDIVSPAWDDGPWDCELGIAYHGENGPVYYTGNGIETTDDLR
jgi:hypothetical protein